MNAKQQAIQERDASTFTKVMRAELIRNVDNIPHELRDLKAWLCWRCNEIDDKGKVNKTPIYAISGKNRSGVQGSPDDIKNLTTYEEAMSRFKNDPTVAGIGFATLDQFGVVILDIDRCIKEGELRDDTLPLIKKTYVESSPSDTGVHGIYWGRSSNSKNNEDGYELFSSKGFVTITGNIVFEEQVPILTLEDELLNKLEALATPKKNHSSTNLTTYQKSGVIDQSTGEIMGKRVSPLNQTLLERMDEWVSLVFPQAQKHPNGYRVDSKSLGRNLQEDISIHKEGIKDFGVADQGDPREGRRTPVELVAEYKFGDINKRMEASNWLCEILNIPISQDLYECELTKNWVFCTQEASWINIKTGETMSITSFNLVFAGHAKTVYQKPNGEYLERGVLPAITKYMISYCKCQTVVGTLYVPYMDAIFTLDGKCYLNSYLPDLVPMANPNWQNSDSPKIVQAHLHKMFSNPNEVAMLIQWMAWVVQNPGKKIRWSPLLIGEQGDGKSQLTIVMGMAMGSKNVKCVSQDELNESFNGWAHGHCLAVLEEIKAVGHSRHTVSEKLKAPITNDYIAVLRKGKDGVHAPNTQNYLAVTNHRDAIIIEPSDRRWFPLQTVCSEQRIKPSEYFGGEYWERYHQVLNSDKGAIRGWLLNVDTSNLGINNAPVGNQAKLFMEERSKSSDATDALELLEIGEGYGYTENVIATELFSAAFKFKFGVNLKTNQLSRALIEIGFMKLKNPIKWRDKSRRIYIKPSFLDTRVNEVDHNILIRQELDTTIQFEPSIPPWGNSINGYVGAKGMSI